VSQPAVGAAKFLNMHTKGQKPAVKNVIRKNGTAQKSQNITTADLCSIIKQCAESGVASLSFDSLLLVFNQKIEQLPTEARQMVAEERALPEEARHSEEDELAKRELELAELMIADPSAYEHELAKEALLDGENNQRPQSVLR
jgi:hypothetical protein